MSSRLFRYVTVAYSNKLGGIVMNTQQKEKDELQNLSIEEVNVYGSCGDPKIHCLYDCFFWNDCFITCNN